MEQWSDFYTNNKIRMFYVFVALFAILAVMTYQRLTYTFITIEFKEMRPVHERLSVYYKGFKVGRVRTIMPDGNYNATLMKVILYPSDLKLPANTIAKLQREKRQRGKSDFIELIAPETQSDLMLGNGSLIEGISTMDIESYLASQDPESLDKMKDDLASTITSLQGTIETLGQFFAVLQEIAQENQPNIKKATDNLVLTSENIKQAASKLNNSIKEEHISGTLTNVNMSSSNVVETTRNLRVISENVDVLTKSLNSAMPQITSSITEAGCIIKNLNEITCGVSKTMKKRFGGMRLFFGKAIDEECSCGCK